MTTAQRVLVFDGIGETGVHTMAGGLARLLHLPVVHVEYNREYGPVGGTLVGQSYWRTRDQGGKAGLAILEDGIPSLLIGFSAGAHIAGDLAWLDHPAIVGAILIADPMQPSWVTRDLLSGVSGQIVRGALVHRTGKPAKPIRWEYNKRDMICQCPDNSPWRDVADVTELMTMRPVDRRAFVLDICGDFADRLRRPRFIFDLLGEGRRWARALDDGLGYLAPPVGRGEHVKYGANWLQLADWARSL